MKLSKLTQTFVLHFGEMGSRWGINRTVGQIYALLYLSPKPLNAEEICDALGFSRSNVSMGLKELDAWQLIRMKHLPEDRREYYSTPEDIMEIFRTVVEQRRKREIEPTMTVLRDVLMENHNNTEEEYAANKILQMHNLIEMVMDWYQQFQKLDNERFVTMLNLGTKVTKFYDFTDKLLGNAPSDAVPAEPAASKCRRHEFETNTTHKH